MMRVSARLDRGAFALDVAFSHERGVTALFGPSGSGKTTTISIVAGLVRPQHGRIEFGGDVLLDTELGINVPPHRRRIGLVYQDAQLFPHMTVEQNLSFGRWFAADHRLPDPAPIIARLGIRHLLDRRVFGLSGGERQRVAIGRALLAGPRALLLDEPLASLDRERKQEILPLIEEIAATANVPIIYVSHALEEVARLASQVVVLDQGRVEAIGPPEDVLASRDIGPGSDRFAVVSIIAGTLEAHDERHGLTPLRHPAGTLYLAGNLGPPGRRCRVVVRATDVALATQRPRSLSIRNILEGNVTGIVPSNGASAIVAIALDGGGSLRASLTRFAIDELGLGPGDRVHALIKTAAIDERPIG